MIRIARSVALCSELIAALHSFPVPTQVVHKFHVFTQSLVVPFLAFTCLAKGAGGLIQ